MTQATLPAFTPSAFLRSLGDRYEELKRTGDALKATAVAQNRALTETENQTLAQLRAQSEPLHVQYMEVYSAEERDAQIAQTRARLVSDAATDAANGGRPVGGATTQQRDPGHYRSVKQGGKLSFFGDIYKAQHGDRAAQERLQEHTRAIDTAGEGAGVLPPKWMADLFEENPRDGRPLASAVRNIPLGDDPRPMSIPKQNGAAGHAGNPVTVDQAEVTNSTPNTVFTDAWDSTVVTVTPLATTGGQIVTRQLLDMASPAIDQLIFGDLLGAYNDGVEAKVMAAIATLGTALAATDADIADPTHYDAVALQAGMAVRTSRKRAPNAFVMSPTRYGYVLGLRDTTGRPLVPATIGQQVNVSGVGTIEVDGIWHGQGVIASPGVTQGDDRFWSVRLQDIILFESNMYRFRYEQPLGPDLVKLGIWGYTACHVQYGTTPVKRVEIDES